MVTLIVPNTYLVAITGESSGQTITNVIGIEANFETAESVATAVGSKWTAATGPCARHATFYLWKSVTATFLGTADGDVATYEGSQAGLVSGTLATNAACALVTYGGGSRARTSKGRLYHGPLTDAQVNADGRTLLSTAATDIGNAYGQFRDQLATLSMNWVVISRKLMTTNPVGSMNVQGVIATQRRRIRG